MASKIIGMPDLNIAFKGLGVSAVARGAKGQAVLIVKEEEDLGGKPYNKFYSVDDITTEVEENYSEKNIQHIKDVLSGKPSELIVIKINEAGLEGSVFNPTTMSESFVMLKSLANINCWIAIADSVEAEEEELISFVKAQNKSEKRKYKALVYQATSPDDMHITNFTTDEIKFKGDDVVYSGRVFIPELLGAITGNSLDMSLIAKKFDDVEFVTEPEDKDVAVDEGELFLFNDEGGKIGIGRAVNSLTTTGGSVTDDMKFILIVEVMDLIYADIYQTWNNSYKGRYKNILDNQMLLVGAINAYFQTISGEYLLDPNFVNKSEIDIKSQKLANIPKYGEEDVNSWDDNRIKEMTVGTHVFLQANIKIPNATEDLKFAISF